MTAGASMYSAVHELQGKLGPDAEDAVRRLLMRVRRLRLRASRSRSGSNERRKCANQASSLQACAGAIVSDEKLREHLREKGLLDAGWLPLNNAVADYARKQAKAVRDE